jgi:hypothetical protein
VWAFDQIDDAYRAALKVTPEQYVNQFPFEACLVMKHHLADTVKQVGAGNTAGLDPSKHVRKLNRTDTCWDWMRGLAAEELRSTLYTSPCWGKVLGRSPPCVSAWMARCPHLTIVNGRLEAP